MVSYEFAGLQRVHSKVERIKLDDHVQLPTADS